MFFYVKPVNCMIFCDCLLMQFSYSCGLLFCINFRQTLPRSQFGLWTFYGVSRSVKNRVLYEFCCATFQWTKCSWWWVCTAVMLWDLVHWELFVLWMSVGVLRTTRGKCQKRSVLVSSTWTGRAKGRRFFVPSTLPVTLASWRQSRRSAQRSFVVFVLCWSFKSIFCYFEFFQQNEESVFFYLFRGCLRWRWTKDSTWTVASLVNDVTCNWKQKMIIDSNTTRVLLMSWHESLLHRSRVLMAVDVDVLGYKINTVKSEPLHRTIRTWPFIWPGLCHWWWWLLSSHLNVSGSDAGQLFVLSFASKGLLWSF